MRTVDQNLYYVLYMYIKYIHTYIRTLYIRMYMHAYTYTCTHVYIQYVCMHRETFQILYRLKILTQKIAYGMRVLVRVRNVLVQVRNVLAY